MSYNLPITKKDLDIYLKELAKEFRKRNRKTIPAEIILIGGASILINYGFRDTTYDMDAIIKASSSMKDAINYVGDKYALPVGWLNSDFTHTSSYSPKLVQYSTYYKTYSNILEIRTIGAEYLVAMKLMAGRKYKHDLSDVIGILYEHQQHNNPLSLEMIKAAITNLYGTYNAIPNDSQLFIERLFTEPHLDLLYNKIQFEEQESKELLLAFQADYPGVTTKDNINEILQAAKRKKNPKR